VGPLAKMLLNASDGVIGRWAEGEAYVCCLHHGGAL
jgi:hypothetical protein